MEGCLWCIGDGNRINIWCDQWIPNSDSSYMTMTMPSSLKNANVSSFFIQNEKCWDRDVICNIFNTQDDIRILNISLSARSNSNKIIWKLDDDGFYFVRS